MDVDEEMIACDGGIGGCGDDQEQIVAFELYGEA